jgi:hypothetical protein
LLNFSYQNSKLELIAQCKTILAQGAAIKEWHCMGPITSQEAQLAEAILAGNYDSDIAMNSQVSLFLNYNNTSAPFTILQRAFAGTPPQAFTLV